MGLQTSDVSWMAEPAVHHAKLRCQQPSKKEGRRTIRDGLVEIGDGDEDLVVHSMEERAA